MCGTNLWEQHAHLSCLAASSCLALGTELHPSHSAATSRAGTTTPSRNSSMIIHGGTRGDFIVGTTEHLTLVPKYGCCGKTAAVTLRVCCCCWADSRCSAEGNTLCLAYIYFSWRKKSWKRDCKVSMGGYFYFSVGIMGLYTVTANICINEKCFNI